MAEDVSPLVNVKGHPPDEQGDFYLTTVSMKEGVLVDYLYSFLSGNVDLIPEEKVLLKASRTKTMNAGKRKACKCHKLRRDRRLPVCRETGHGPCAGN